MKKSLLLFVLCVGLLPAYSAIHTVSNLPGGGAQFTTLHAAYIAASNGDTIMLQGSNAAYNLTGVNWAKSLVVIGAGLYPNKDNQVATTISTTTFSSFYLTSAGSGSKFYGILFSALVLPEYNNLNISLYFEACQFNNYVSVDYNQGTWSFVNCRFETDNYHNVSVSSASTSMAGLEFRNCIFDGYINGANNPGIPILLDHCLFLATTVSPFTTVRNATISNSIFRNRFPDGVTNTSFLNNLCAVSGVFPPAGGGGNSALNNIENTDPLFTTYTSGQLFNPNHDYHLQAGSTAIGAGSDGTDIGLFGGNTGFNMFFEPQNAPVVRRVLIQNPSISPNGTLNVTVQASTPRND